MNPLLAMIANADKLKDCRYHFQVIVELDLDHYNEIDLFYAKLVVSDCVGFKSGYSK